jgi:DNA polymerase III subunit gamma/tau
MSYLVLARKYRPKNFSEMVGQAHVVQALSNALTTQRLHHAYLFTGTRGVGKTTVSRILAKSLNCQGTDGQGGITATPCGVCPACTDIDAGRFVDYTELDAASNRGVDEVQALLEQAVYKPVQGRFKVFMIDEVHMLTGHAFNAMLKTLEEPPEYLKFVLATTDPQKVPVTVLSRCLQFNLRPMAPETVLEHLQQVLKAEAVGAEVQALRLIARAARGSMRDALSLTDQAIAFGSGQLQEATVRQMLGSVDRGYVFRLIDALARGDGRSVVETSEALRVNGLSAASTLEEMATVLQRMAVLQAVPDEGDDADPDAADTRRLAAALPPDETQLLYTLCLHGRAELGLAPDDYAALTMVLLRLLAFKPAAASAHAVAHAPRAPAEKKTLIDTAAPAPRSPVAAAPPPLPAPVHPPLAPLALQPAPVRLASPGPVPPFAKPPGQRLPVVAPPQVAQARPSRAEPGRPHDPDAAGDGAVVAVPVRQQPEQREPASAAAPVVVPTEEGDFWFQTVQQLAAAEAITALVRELALQSQLVARDTDHWVLRVERESLNQPTPRERLQNALRAAGHAVTLGVEVGRVTDSPARRNAQAAAERQQAAEAAILGDPFVQSMMRDFGARIVPGSIKSV